MLDRLPAPVRHLLIVIVATAVGVLGEAVFSAQGVTGVDWPATLVAALNAAAVAAVAALGTLYVTPLTRQYGVGSPPA